MRSIAAWLVMVLFLASGKATWAVEVETAYRAGAAKALITPAEPMYLAGFGDRVVPAEGTLLDLQAKALAIVEHTTSTRLVIVTLDLIEVPIQLRELLVEHARQKHQLPPESLLLNCSHTHCGPELRFAERDLATLAPERAAMCRRYNQFLTSTLTKLIDDALGSAVPAKVSYGHARCGFAMNRRLKNEVPGGEPYLNRPNPDGVVDHDVPVLKVENTTGKLLAVMFGYACHNTTLHLKQFHADYAGYAQQAIEAAHPETIALFMMGCGGDQNGYPRMKLPHSEQHGRSLATAVEAALEAKSRSLTGQLKLAYGVVPLDLQPAPSAERLKARLATGAEYPASGRAYFEVWDRRRLAELEQGTLLRQYPFPAQVIRFGDGLTFIALAGETVVDYSLRLKRELQGSAAVWVAGYSNDVFAYVPSKRVLLEGGYEAERSMMY
ncbi:MAG: neutral/alkaline non-lysosomal ceramidase N-terminal domain-containing protein, partial [Planctomycetaceae bacterium]|nr:neutral/alkaline non-lysosomal ceramidase N-terminal domain-containing protein [Planctomycetaceae bacterium]